MKMNTLKKSKAKDPNSLLNQNNSIKENSGMEKILKAWRRDKYLFLMSFIPVVLIIIFKYLPIYGIIMAFERYTPADGFLGSQWVGLEYFKMFFQDPYCGRIIKNTFLLSIYSLLWGFPAPIILALILNEVRSQWFKRGVQTITYLPYFMSGVIVVGLMKEMLSPVDGIITKMMNTVGIHSINFFAEPSWFRTLYIGSGVWQSLGFSAIIYLAALAGIDMEQYEAAIIDGANRFQKIIYITLPGIMPTVIILLILGLGNIFSSDFTKILLMYSPATYDTADVIATYTYRYGIENASYSYAAAVGLLQSVMSFLLIYGANFISKKTTENSLW